MKKRKANIGIIGIAVFLVLLSAVSAVDATVVKVEPATQTVLSSQSFSVNVTVEGVTYMGADQATLNFDPIAMTVSSVTEGDFLKSGGATMGAGMEDIDNTNGYVTFFYSLTTPSIGVDGSGTLATIYFDTNASAEGESILDLTDVVLPDGDGNTITVDEVSDGTVTITGVANQPPYKPNEPLPENGATNVTTSPTLSVLVSDPDGDSMTVTFYNDSDDNVIGSVTGVANGTRASVIWSELENETEYSWYVTANDSELENGSDTWSFTTVAEGAGIHDISIKPDYTGAYDTGIRIDSATEEEIPLDQNLAIGKTYIIKYKVENKGTVGEEEGVNITVTVSNATGWSEELANYSQNINAHHLGSVDWHTTGLAQGDYIITVNASIPVDNNPGNNERTRAVTLVTVAIDGTAPTTEVTIPPDATTIPSGTELPWTNEDVNISFRRTDNGGGNPSGINYTNLSTSETVTVNISNETAGLYANNTELNATGYLVNSSFGEYFNVTISEECNTTIYYYSVDDNETPNIESPTKNVTVRIDLTDPIIISVELNKTSVDASEPINVSVNVTDPEGGGFASGIANVTADGVGLTQNGNWWNGTITAVTTAGTHNVTVTAYDNASNTVTNDTVQYEVRAVYGVELIAPANRTTSVNVNATYGIVVNNTGSVTDTFNLTVDNLETAAVANLSTEQVTLDAGANTTVLLNVTDGTAGTYNVSVTATSDTDSNANDTITVMTTVLPINITAFTVDATAERGHTLNAIVTVKNEGSSTLNNVTIVVSGVEIFGYPLVGTGVIGGLDAAQETTLRMLVYVPPSADLGDYSLFADVWLYEDYPVETKAIYRGPEVTSVIS